MKNLKEKLFDGTNGGSTQTEEGDGPHLGGGAGK